MPNYRIELRSDTKTVPTPAMREAMARAQVGDEIAGEDPTVKELERTACDILGKEAALFVTSGTMGNLVSLLTIASPGDTLFVDPNSHVVIAEMGGYARLAGCTVHPVDSQGVLTAAHVRAHFARAWPSAGRPAIIWTENSHNRCGGVAWGPEILRDLVEVKAEFGLKLHVDGARLFNAAVAQNVPPRELAAGADTVTFCLSKGLGAPFGSIIVGAAATIQRARQVRQLVGGGMRQAGVMAAAGLVALREGPARLAADHRRARQLGSVIEDIEGLSLAYPVQTNLVFINIDPDVLDPGRFFDDVTAQGVGASPPRPGTRMFRLVTHHQVSDDDLAEAGEVLARAAERARVRTVAAG